MNKKILCFVSCFALIFSIFFFLNVQNASAEENNEYTFIINGICSHYSNNEGQLTVTFSGLPSTTNVCGAFNSSNYQYIFCLSSTFGFRDFVVDYNFTVDGRTYTTSYKPTGFGQSYSSGDFAVNFIPDGSFWTFQTLGLVKSNMPIFTNSSDVSNYFNFGTINNPVYEPTIDYEYDSSIEPPLNLKIYKTFPNVSTEISLNQSENILERKLQVSSKRKYKYGWKLLNLGTITYSSPVDTELITIGTYDNNSINFDVVIPLSEFESSFSSVIPLYSTVSSQKPSPAFMYSDEGWFLDDDTIYIRNVVGNKASNWIRFNTNDSGTSYNAVINGEDNNPTDIVDNNVNSSTGYGSDYYNNIRNSSSFDGSDLFNYVRSGLGIVGSTGLVVMIGQTFSYLPNELITILLFGAVLLVVVGIVKVVTS